MLSCCRAAFAGAVIVIIGVVCAATALGQNPNGQEARGVVFHISMERWDGYTEYRIIAGRTIYGPTEEEVIVGSRLKFPVKTYVAKAGGAFNSERIHIAGHFALKVHNQRTTFEDWDYMDRMSGQKTFIYGSATNTGDVIGFDVSAGYRFHHGSFEFRPGVEFIFLRMDFEEETAEQVNYAYFDTITGSLEPLDPPYYSRVEGPVLLYTIDYKLLYFGGDVIYRYPGGFEAQGTAMIAPVCWASDLDEHLLRYKTGEISSSGRSGYAKIRLGWRINSYLSISANASYYAIHTSGPQTQEIYRPERLTIDNIPAKTKAEWATVGIGLSVDLGTLNRR